MNKQQLASKIWESANGMRSKIDANDYKDYILGFIFYKFLSDKLLEKLLKDGFDRNDLENDLKEDNLKIVKYCQRNYGYFISYSNLFSTWLDKGKGFDVSNVRDALSAFDRLISKTHETVYKGIFETLQTGLSNLGSTASEQTKAISKLINLIAEIPMDGKQDYDVLGFIYEYLISMFAANAGKKAGEFYTPHEVSVAMSEIVAHHLKDNEKIEIYDPTSGSGSLLINIGKSIAKHMKDPDNIKYYAQELKKNTYNLTRMNLVMRGIKPDNIVTRNADTLEQDWPYIDENNNYSPLYVDVVVSNPPYSQKWNPENKESDPRYSDFGVAPKSKADYAFLLHDLFHVKPNGVMTIVLPHGALFRGGSEGEIRKNLIENNNIDTIIGLPANIFFGTGIPTVILILKQKRDEDDVLIIDASKGFIKDGKKNKLQASDIRKIVDTVIGRQNNDKYSRVVLREEVRENNYNLNIPRYVDSSEPKEDWDIYSIMFGGIPNKEIAALDKYWEIFPTLKEDMFTPINDKYSQLSSDDLDGILKSDSSIENFKKEFVEKFSDFSSYLYDRLITNIEKISIANEKQAISNALFARLESNKLINKYEAYQLFDDVWQTISIDLEIIKTEGKESLTKVIPNMVSKKKGGQNIEVQDGYAGYIIPFEIAQKIFLASKLEEVQNKEKRIIDIQTNVVELFESLSDEDKELDVVKEDKTAFVNSKVLKYVKSLSNNKTEDEEIDSILRKVQKAILEERSLKKELKISKEKLHLETKTLIENLSTKQIHEILEEKWVKPITESISNLVETTLNDFIKKVVDLSKKYKQTLVDVEEEISSTSKQLNDLLSDLTGDEYSLLAVSELKKLLEGE